MKRDEIQALLPELYGAAFAQALEDDRVRAAVRDLESVLGHLARSSPGSPERADWEATRDELVAEIRRSATRTKKMS